MLEGDAAALTGVFFLPGAAVPPALPQIVPPLLGVAAVELEEYFCGTRRSFSLPLAPRGSAFQLALWEALADIPDGATTTYGDLARRLGRPAASRAVGQAVGANPLPIVLACHRVVAANGRLGGYAGGTGTKRRLLALEGAAVAAR